MTPDFARWREQLAAKGVTNSAELAAYLLDQYGIATLPTSDFGVDPSALSLRVASSYIDMESDEAAAAVLMSWRAHRDPAQLMAQHPQMTQAIAALQSFVRSLS